jgi:hypothetical protein
MDVVGQSLFPTLTLRNTACVFVVTEKLPFAGYSVVKEQPGGLRPARPPYSLTRGAPSPYSVREERIAFRLAL